MQPFEKIGMKSVVKEISKLISVYSLLATVLKKREISGVILVGTLSSQPRG